MEDGKLQFEQAILSAFAKEGVDGVVAREPVARLEVDREASGEFAKVADSRPS